MSFPISPTDGQISTVNNIKYQYNSAANYWARIPYDASTGGGVSVSSGFEQNFLLMGA